MTDLLEAYRSFMQCQFQYKEKHPHKHRQKRPFVTISRQTGAGGITIGRKLVEYLVKNDQEAYCPWTIFDKTLVAEVIKEHNLPKEYEKYLTEERTSEIKDIVETLFELHPPTFALVRQTSQTILHLAHMGYVVIVGRGANVVTKDLPDGYHVRLVGSLEKRLKHVQEYYHLDAVKAAKKIQTEDEGRTNYLKQNFGKNIDDASLYDEVINTDHTSYEAAAEKIGKEVLKRANAEASKEIA